MTYDTDKEVLGYVPEYRLIAADLGPAARVCEIGVQTGGSLRMWQDLFPRGVVAGVDSDPSAHWPDGTIKIVTGQDNPALAVLLQSYSAHWDLVIDDASHVGSLTAATFDLLWPLISPGGRYVIEDWFIGLPGWRAAQAVIPGGYRAPYDPGLLQLVQELLVRLDRPYPGWTETARLPRDSDVESVTCRYGMAVVQKAAAP